MVEFADVPSDHDFFDADYVRTWAKDALRKDPERPEFLDAFVTAITGLEQEVVVLELGSGPGFLAEQILGRCRIERYYLVDFSPAMHALSRTRLADYAARTVFIEADLRDPDWPSLVPTPAHAVVSMQALHELRHRDRAPGFYTQVATTLIPAGLVLVCDHLRAPHDDRPLFMSVEEHLGALRAGGLIDVEVALRRGDNALFSAKAP